MEQDPRAQGAAEPSVHHRPYATPASYDAAISHRPHVAAPSHEMIPAPAPHPGSHPEPSQHAASGQASAAKPVGRLGTTCRAVYCQGEDARITKANPGVDVPKKDIARRGAFLMRIWQSCVGDNSPQLHERVQKDLAEAARRLEVIKQKKANGERVNPTDYPSRIRIHRSHFPPGSFEKSNDRRLTCDADRMKDTALPFNYLEYRSWKQQQAPELQGWSNGPEGQQPPAPLLEGERTDANQADNAAKRKRFSKRSDPQLLLEEMQQAERELKKLKKEIDRMESDRATANERLEIIKGLMKGYEKRSTAVQKRTTGSAKKSVTAGGTPVAKRPKNSAL